MLLFIIQSCFKNFKNHAPTLACKNVTPTTCAMVFPFHKKLNMYVPKFYLQGNYLSIDFIKIKKTCPDTRM